MPAALTGGLALAAWRHVRTTRDVDLVVGIDLQVAENLQAELKSAGFRRQKSNPIEFDDTRLFQFTYEPEETFVAVKVDLLCAQSRFALDALARSVDLEESVLGFALKVLRCEDLIVFKLLAGRIIDFADAAELIRANETDIDQVLLDRVASECGVAPQLATAQIEANR